MKPTISKETLEHINYAVTILESELNYSYYNDRHSRTYLHCNECRAQAQSGYNEDGEKRQLQHKPDCKLVETTKSLKAFVEVESTLHVDED